MDAETSGAESNFDALMAEMDRSIDLMKSMDTKADDPDADPDEESDAGTKKIPAAAKEGKKASDKKAAKDGEGGDGFWGKSMTIEVDGKEVEAYDATEMMKALHAENEGLRAHILAIGGRASTATKEATARVCELGERIKQQDVLIKALQADIKRIGDGGVGRRAVLTIHDKPAGVAPAREGVSAGDLKDMTLKAMTAGRISGLEATMVEARLGRGEAPDADILRRIQSA